MSENVVGDNVHIFLGLAKTSELHSCSNHYVGLSTTDIMSKQSVRCKENSCNRVFLVREELDVRAHIGKFKERTIKNSSSNISVFTAVSFLKSFLAILILPYPVFEFLNHLILLVQNLYGFILVDDSNFSIVVFGIGNAKCFHIEDVFHKIKHIHTICTVNGVVELLVKTVLLAFSKSCFFRDFPNACEFIVANTVFRISKRLSFIAVDLDSTNNFWFLADQIQDEVVDDICRYPRRSKCDVDIFYRNIGFNKILKSLDVIIKVSVIFEIGFLCGFKLLHQVSAQILVRRLPTFIKAFIPKQRVLINGATKLFNDFFGCFSGDRRNKFNINCSQSIQRRHEGIRDRFYVGLRSIIISVLINVINREVHARDTFNVLATYFFGSSCRTSCCFLTALAIFNCLFFSKDGLLFLSAFFLFFFHLKACYLECLHSDINIFFRKDLSSSFYRRKKHVKNLAFFFCNGGRIYRTLRAFCFNRSDCIVHFLCLPLLLIPLYQTRCPKNAPIRL